MRIVGLKELRAFSVVLDELEECTAEMARVLMGTAAIVQANALSNTDAALEIGMAAGGKLINDYNHLVERFEKAAFAFLGERRGGVETADGFLWRIARMGELDLLATQQRNGIRLEV